MCIIGLIISFVIWFLINLFFMSFVLPLPLNDQQTVRYRSLPWTTYLLITINAGVFLMWLAPTLYDVEGTEMIYFKDYVNNLYSFGYRETLVRGSEGYASTGIGAFANFTSMFMHADLWHFFGNMVYLWAFGRRIEDACGHWRFLLFYLLAGTVANMGWALLVPGLENRPGIGASGAIAGVMGAYLLLFPRARIRSLWGLGAIIRLPFAAFRSEAKTWTWTLGLPAWFLLGLFVLRNVGPSIEQIRGADTPGVNYVAHIAGFAAALIIFFYVRKDLLMRFLTGRAL